MLELLKTVHHSSKGATPAKLKKSISIGKSAWAKAVEALLNNDDVVQMGTGAGARFKLTPDGRARAIERFGKDAVLSEFEPKVRCACAAAATLCLAASPARDRALAPPGCPRFR